MTPTTPYGKLDDRVNPLELYLSLGIPFIVSELSTRPKDLARNLAEAMEYPGFSVVHIQSPCTTYNDTFSALRGDPKRGIEPLAYPLPDDHDPADYDAAMEHARSGRIPVGVLYRRPDSVPMQQRLEEAKERVGAKQRSVEEMLAAARI